MAETSDRKGLAPRRAALALLRDVTERGRMLHEDGPALARLGPQERARALRLAGEALRQAGRADRVLKPHLARKPPPAVRAILQIATVEIAQGAAAHGVVDAWVEVAGGSQRTASYRGLVNAVLRKLEGLTPEAWEKLPVPILPRWLRRPLVEAWGDRTLQRIEDAHMRGAPLDLTPRSDADAGALATETGATLLPTGSLRHVGPAQVTALPGYAEGRFWVQDAAAALPVRLLAPEPGARVLDLCAAPGGKTLQLCAAGAEVTALDLSEDRLARVAENLARCGLEARIVAADALAFDEGGWDAICLDAPCSATGTIRRHPDLPVARDGAGIDALIAQQADLIDHALTLLKPGGRLLYCTCSLIPDEGEVQVEEACARHPGLTVAPLPEAPWIEPDWIAPEGGLRTRPDHWADRGGMDGFFMAVLIKPA